MQLLSASSSRVHFVHLNHNPMPCRKRRRELQKMRFRLGNVMTKTSQVGFEIWICGAALTQDSEGIHFSNDPTTFSRPLYSSAPHSRTKTMEDRPREKSTS